MKIEFFAALRALDTADLERLMLSRPTPIGARLRNYTAFLVMVDARSFILIHQVDLRLALRALCKH